MNIAAAQRVAARMDRRWTFRALLVAGVMLSLAGFVYLDQRDRVAAEGQFHSAVAGAERAIRREILARRPLLEMTALLLSREATPPSAVEDVLRAYRASLGPGTSLVWVPWDGGNRIPSWQETHRYFCAADAAPPWLADGLRRAVEARETITVPGTSQDGEELLTFAVSVHDPQGGVRGVVLVISSLTDLVERAIRNSDAANVRLLLEDASLGGRTLYTHEPGPAGSKQRSPRFQAAFTFPFADRVWTLRAASTAVFPIDRGLWTRWHFLVAGILLALSGAAAASLALDIAARARDEAERRLRLAEESVAMGVWDWNIVSGSTSASPAVLRLFGLPPAAPPPTQEEWFVLIHPDDRSRMRDIVRRAMESGEAYEAEYRVVRSDGSVRWLLTKGTLFRDQTGRATRLLGVLLDISALKTAERALSESEARVHRMFAKSSIGMVLADAQGRILEASDFACRATGYTREELVARRTADLIYPGDCRRQFRRFRHLLNGSLRDYVTEVRVLRRDGGMVWMRLSLSPLVEDGRTAGVVALCEDVTARRTAESQLEYQLLNDPVTGLPNRRLLDDRLNQALAESKRSAKTLAVFALDIDGLGSAAESIGGAGVDALLTEVARRLRAALRASDTLARIGYHEFAVLAPNLEESADGQLISRKLIEAMQAPFPAAGQEIALTVCAGVSLFPRHSSDAGELVRQAQVGLHAARGEGHNRCRQYTPELGRVLRERVELESRLRGAAARGEITVHYQPEYDLRNGHLVGFEALARWKHPKLGLVPPSRFIPIAEETGLIVPIGLLVLEEACRSAVLWQKPGWPPVQVAVNVSATQFAREDFVDRVLDTLRRTGLPPTLLQLELTESVLLGDFTRAAAKMEELRSAGVTLAVDDFGTGYSSLSYLPNLPFQAMKIDRSFVRNLHDAAESRTMIESLVALAHNLNLNVVVEGVESPAELSWVRALGCDTVQGYLLGRPSASAEKHLEGDRRILLPTEMLTYS